MKRQLIICGLLLCSIAACAQNNHKARYERLVKAVGVTGVGVETILDRWEEETPEDPELLEARFSWNFVKSQKSTVVQLDRTRYMGRKPVLSLNDSTSASGKKNYFEDTDYDPDYFKAATQYINKAIRISPNELKYRFDKISALLAYEKESPDMATDEIRTLIDYNASAAIPWTYNGEKTDEEFFKSAVQEYCFNFFSIGSEKSYESFHEISEKMLSYYPKETVFLDNIGSWWLIAQKNEAQAVKFYKKVLKINPKDYTAIKNMVIIARNGKDLKLEKKYLPKLIEVSPDEKERTAAQARLDGLGGAKARPAR